MGRVRLSNDSYLQLVHDVMIDRQLSIKHQGKVLLYLQEPGAQSIEARCQGADVSCQRAHCGVLHIPQQMLHPCVRHAACDPLMVLWLSQTLVSNASVC